MSMDECDAAVVNCPNCNSVMEEVDPASTPGAKSWECPDCAKAIRAEGDGGKYHWQCPRCGAVIRDSQYPSRCPDCNKPASPVFVERVIGDE